MTRAIGPRRSAPWNGPLRGATGRGDTRAKRQDSTRSATVYMQGKLPTHETQHKYSTHHDVEWRRQNMRMRSSVLCIRNY